MRGAGFAVVAVLVMPVVALAQTEPGPPGPYVIDMRGAMMSVPNSVDFFPDLPDASAVPGRGFGVDLGAHVMLRARVGGGRVGVGANLVTVQGRVGPPDVLAGVVAFAPQLSLNFGTADGWSHLSAGYGVARLTTTVREAGSDDLTAGTGMVPAFNFGGGARWFVNPRLATTFDLRFHRFSASGEQGTPATMRMALSVGVSVR